MACGTNPVGSTQPKMQNTRNSQCQTLYGDEWLGRKAARRLQRRIGGIGGNDLRTAYATTARQMLSAETIAKQPQIGDLFEFRVDVPGVPCPLVRY